jgi:hypothetical protein
MPAYSQGKLLNYFREIINLIHLNTFWLQRQEYGMTMRYAVGTRKTGTLWGSKNKQRLVERPALFLYYFMYGKLKKSTSRHSLVKDKKLKQGLPEM